MENASIITQIVVAILGVLLPLAVGGVAFVIKRHINNIDTLKALEQFAKSSVVLAEKIGQEKELSGSTKKNYAIVGLQNMLVNAGFKPIDRDILTAEVEKAYFLLKKEIEYIYAK